MSLTQAIQLVDMIQIDPANASPEGKEQKKAKFYNYYGAWVINKYY